VSFLPARLRATVARLAESRPVAGVRRVATIYDDAGGALLAGGLAYSALFALLPALLLLTGILGLVVDDPARREAIVEGLAENLPPLRDLLVASLAAISDGAVGFGILGLLGLTWGASRFYTALDDAFARIFRDVRHRGFLERTIRGLVSVVLLAMTFIAALVFTAIASLLVERVESRLPGADVVWQVATPIAAALVFVAAVALTYRLVPPGVPRWSAVVLPSFMVGIGLALLTQLFSYVAPRLVGSAAVYGTFVALFAAMIWLSFGFQLLLLGAAWVRVRAT
jgi:membrane protein